MPNAILLLACPDKKGLVARLAGFIYDHNGNIIHADHHTDFEAGVFLSRLEWDLDRFELGQDEIGPAFNTIAREIDADWSVHFSDMTQRMAVWVTREDHCLVDLIWRQRSGDLRAEIPLIVSNRTELRRIADEQKIPFLHLEMTKENKAEQEARALEALAEHGVDLVVLAKYMQVLSKDFLRRFPNVINIHHSFLPAFPGARPYHQAYERGVKIIGATAHYVTEDLDEGPIIEQDVVRVSHRDSVQDLVRRGRDLERSVLSRAVRYHLENRVLQYRNRTIVFA